MDFKRKYFLTRLFILSMFAPLFIYCKPEKKIVESLYNQDNTEYSLQKSRNYYQIGDKILDESFDIKLLDLIEDKKILETANNQQKNSERVKSLLNSDDKVLMEEQIREKLIERLKKIYVKTSRSR
jgi:hypothetical protein